MDRNVLVTGANSGIGLATVIEVARRGYRAVGSVRSEEKAEHVRQSAAAADVTVDTVLLDVTDTASCTRVMDEVGPLYGLVNNAGFGGVGAVEDVSDEEARAMFETMVLAPTRLARLAMPGMRELGGGRVVNVSSIFGRVTMPLTGWYQGCKHAIEALSDALRAEVASDGVRVILIEPGGFRTGIWEDLDRDVDERAGSTYADAYRRTQWISRMAAPLMGEPERVASLIGRVLSHPVPRARYLIGYDAQAAAVADRFALPVVKDRLTRMLFGL